MNDLVVGVRLKADNSGFVPEVRQSREELAKLAPAATATARAVDQETKAADRAGKAQAEWSASVQQGTRALGGLNTSATAAARAIEQSAQAARRAKEELGETARASDQLGAVLKRAGAVAAGAFAGIGIVELGRGIISTADQMRQLEGRLSLVVNGAKQLAAVQGELFQIAQRNLAPLADTLALYTRLAMSLEGTNTSQARMLALTNAVQQSLRISGANAANASSVMMQFSQAMAAGVLRGDEFNSMMENGPRLAQALAAGLGVSTGALRAMAEQGELTRDRIIGALESQYDALNQQSSKLPETVGAAWQTLRNEVQRYIGDVDKSSGASAALAAAIGGLADNVRTLASAVGNLLELGLFVGGGVLLGSVAAHAAKLAPALGGVAAGIAAINAQTLLFVGGAALSRLAALSAVGKGGLIGLALWGGYEAGGLVRGWTENIQSVNHGLDAFIDRLRDIAGLDTVADKQMAALARGEAIQAQANAARRQADATYRQQLVLPESERARRAPNFATQLSTEGFEARQQRAKQLAQEEATAERERAQALAQSEKQTAALIARVKEDTQEYRRALARLQEEGAAEQLAQLDEMRKKRREDLIDRVEEHRQALRTEVEAERERHALVLRDLQDALDSRVVEEARIRTLRERAESDHQARLADILEASQREARRAMEQEEERRRELLLQPFRNAIDGMQDAFAGFFERVFSGGVNSFKDLAAAIKQTFVRLAAEVAALLVFRPIAGNLLGALGAGGLASQLQLLGGSSASVLSGASGNAISGLGTLGQLASPGGGLFGQGFSLSSLLSTPKVGIYATDLAARLGLGNTGQMIAGNIGANVGYGLLGMGAANLFGLGGGTAGNIGGTIGGLAGSFFGPVGGVAGGFLGSVFGGLFGGKPARQTGGATFNSSTGVMTSSGAKASTPDAAIALGQQLHGILKEFASITGATLPGNLLAVRTVANASKVGESPFSLFKGGYGVGTPLNYGSSEQLLQSGALALLRDNRFITGIPKEYLQALNSATSAQQLLQQAQVIKSQKAATDAQKSQAEALLGSILSTNRFKAEVEALVAQFADLRANASTLGLSLGQIAQAEALSLRGLRTDQTSALRGLVEQGRGILGIPNLEAFGRELGFGTFAQGSPATRLTSARAELERIAAAARAGDVEAINQFPALASSVLQLGRDTYASGPEFQSVFSSVTQTFNQVLQRQRELEQSLVTGITITLKETAADQIAALKEQTSALVASLKVIEERLRKVTA